MAVTRFVGGGSARGLFVRCATAGVVTLCVWVQQTSGFETPDPEPRSASIAQADALHDGDVTAMRLSNGLRLVVVEEPEAHFVNVEHVLGFGSAHEPEDQAGLAHLLEHLMVDAWETSPSSALELDKYALRQNARTSFTTTSYEISCLVTFLPRVLELASLRLTSFDPPADVVAREKFVVREERAMRARVSAWRDLRDEVLRAAYTGHPFERSIGGSDSTIALISLEHLKRFYSRFVAPQNTTLVVRGPVRSTHVLSEVERTHGSMPPHPDFVPPRLPDPPPRARASVEIDRHDVENLSVCIGFRLPTQTKEQFLMALLARDLMRTPGGPRDRLAILPRECFLTFSSNWFYGNDPEDVRPDVLRRYAWDRIWRHIKSRKNIATRADSFEVFRERALERMKTHEDQAWLLGRALLLEDDLAWVAQRDSIMRSFRLADVRAYMERWITPEHASSGAAHGRLSRRPLSLEAASLQRGDLYGSRASDPANALTAAALAPSLAALRASHTWDLEQRELKNRIPLTHVAFPREGPVRVGVLKTHRDVKHARKKPGLMRLYGLVVDSDPTRGAPAWKRLPHSVNVNPSSQRLSMGVEVSPLRLEPAVHALVDRMRSPEFNVSTWRLLQDRAGYYMRPRRSNPDLYARIERWSALLGADHEILGDWRGDPAQVKKWKYDHLRDMHRDVMRTDDMRVLVTGPVDVNALTALLEQTLGKLDGRKERDEWRDAPAVVHEPFVKVVGAFDRRDLRIVFTLLPWTHSTLGTVSWAETEVVRECIRSRVYSRLREREGLSYTVSTDVLRAGRSTILELRASTFPAAGVRAFAAICEELAALAESGIDENVLARAQWEAARRTFLHTHDAEDAFATMNEMALFGPPVQDPVDAILSVDRIRCERLLRAAVDPARLVVSICGPLLEDEAETFARALRD